MCSLEIMIDQCRHCCSLYVAPATQGSVKLHYTIPDLLDMGCAYDHVPGLHQWSNQQWETYPYSEFRTAVEEIALALKSHEHLFLNNLHDVVRVGLLLDNDIYWAMTDMGSLLAGWVTVPLDAGQSGEAMDWIVQDAGLQVLIVSNGRALEQLSGSLGQIKLIVAVNELDLPEWFKAKAQGCAIITLENLRHAGRRYYSPDVIQALKDAIHPEDLATIVYTADARGKAKGVMLSHRSLTGNIWAAFSSMPGLVLGKPEVALSFLPLNHIFARTFLYGHFGFGHDIYFSSSKRVFRHLATVKPTIFITVPRLLEKVYERVNNVRRQSSLWQRWWLNWSWNWAHYYQPSRDRWLGHRIQRWVLGHGVYRALRRAFGGRIRYLLSGGAALQPDVMTFFNAIGIPVKQGYGLTETSSVLSYTRDRWFRSGSVGAPIPGVEMRLATDGEVLVKSPYTMEGYHHSPEATDQVIDAEGWFHTGDFGEFSEDGVLTLRGCKKGLFKLSTGKYVAPGPIESELERSPLVKQALLVGPGQKFCGVLIVPDMGACDGVDCPSDYQALLDQVNSYLSHWSTIKRFVLVESKGAAGDSRAKRHQAYAQEIQELYCEAEQMSEVSPKRLWGWGYLKALYHRDRRVNVA